MKPNLRIHSEGLAPTIESLEGYFKDGGASLVQAAFHHTYFVHSDVVLNNTPLFPNRARCSREYYPGIDKGSPLAEDRTRASSRGGIVDGVAGRPASNG